LERNPPDCGSFPKTFALAEQGDFCQDLYSALRAVNAMLLNEFLKEHRKVQKLEAALEAVAARLTKQETDLQQVRARVASNSAPHLASRD